MNAAELESLFESVPPLAGLSPGDFSITNLPGYTNRNLRICNHREDWVLRVPRASTDRFIDRAAEAHNHLLACDIGIALQPAWRGDSGLMLTPTLAESRSPAAGEFADRSSLAVILEPVRRLHSSGAEFHGRVDLAQLLSRYYAMLDETLQRKYRHRLRAARELLPLLDDRDHEYVPSHNDLVLENLLLDDGRTWLIDWEFSAMASPFWDLASLANAAGLDYAGSRELLRLYCAGGPQMEESLLFDYRNLLQLLSDCWMAALVA
ncbi:MAG TPA: choline/ethanolamine kinase family protein [Gammaproteobacteria bacterium]|nr:choline/ethanolamine kinase family protein [Gammaproteobacteria bacterium]